MDKLEFLIFIEYITLRFPHILPPNIRCLYGPRVFFKNAASTDMPTIKRESTVMLQWTRTESYNTNSCT